MSAILSIPDALETELRAQAARLGIPMPQFALQLLESGLSAMEKPKNGAEMVDYWQKLGLIGFRQDITDTESCYRDLRRQSQARVASEP
jgi:hypothetical protein